MTIFEGRTMKATLKTTLYFFRVIIVGSIPIIGPLLAWNFGFNLAKEVTCLLLTGKEGGMDL